MIDNFSRMYVALSTTDSLEAAKDFSDTYLELPEEEFLTFSVKYLDDVTLGISKNDLVVLSSKTGRGKTQLATNIALANAARGKRVLYYALEAEHHEIEKRIMFNIFADEYYSTFDAKTCGHINFPEFKARRYKQQYQALKQNIDLRMDVVLQNLNTFYRSTDRFAAGDFSSHLTGVVDDFDLVIVDHLQYFDRDDASQTEIEQIQSCMKTMRDLVLQNSKPIILLTHVRKSAIGEARIIPDIDDIYGHSDVIKIATKVLFISPINAESINGFNTLFHLAKYRDNGAVTKRVARCRYAPQKGSYEQDYEIGIIKKGEFVKTA